MDFALPFFYSFIILVHSNTFLWSSSLVVSFHCLTMKPTVIICPGNGCTNIRNSNWYGYLYQELSRRDVNCVCENFPDPLHARRDRWIPFISSLVEQHAADKNSENVILVGHSSGAQAALRFAEDNPLRGAVLVSATYTDLGDAHERASGYYPQPGGKGRESEESNPYRFPDIVKNCKTIYQFHSDDDPFIPTSEAARIRDGLGLDDDHFKLLPGRSHFFSFEPQILDMVLSMC